jgi:hypothetical protein
MVVDLIGLFLKGILCSNTFFSKYWSEASCSFKILRIKLFGPSKIPLSFCFVSRNFLIKTPKCKGITLNQSVVDDVPRSVGLVYFGGHVLADRDVDELAGRVNRVQDRVKVGSSA